MKLSNAAFCSNSERLDPGTLLSISVPSRPWAHLIHIPRNRYSHARNLYSHPRNRYPHPPGIPIHIAPESLFACPGICKSRLFSRRVQITGTIRQDYSANKGRHHD